LFFFSYISKEEQESRRTYWWISLYYRPFGGYTITMRAQLLPLDGGPVVEVVKDLTLVGRKEECDLRLDHKSVSKMHCVLVKSDGLLLLRDLGSTNGTRVNGHRVRRAALLPNDELTIAGYKFRVQFGQAGSEKAPPHAHTQRMNTDDVADLLEKIASAEPASPAVSSPKSLRPNHLPDVYPEKESN
jgi:pSer/pThr/pTyr-binding forkhead associated (FHA) protein